MTDDEMKEFKIVLAQSFKCSESDIFIAFDVITDDRDEEREDCIYLKYMLNSFIDNKLVTRPIFKLKIPIPQHVKDGVRMAEQEKKQALVVRSPFVNVEPPVQQTTLNSNAIKIPVARKPASRVGK